MARMATTSTGASGRAKPLRCWCASWNAAADTDGELVALAGVAAVDGRRRDGVAPDSLAASAASRRRASASAVWSSGRGPGADEVALDRRR